MLHGAEKIGAERRGWVIREESGFEARRGIRSGRVETDWGAEPESALPAA
jgi:hypothetical protein